MKISNKTNKVAAVLKREVSVREDFPGEIERKFRLFLGGHNHYLDMLEISVEIFSRELSKQPNEVIYVRGLAKNLGYHSLHPQSLGFANSRKYLISSHIAYLFSAGDAMCKKVRSHSYLKALKGENTIVFNEINTGDFIRKSVNLVIFSSKNKDERKAKEILEQSNKIFSLASFSVINYYRLVRNEELHSVESEDDKQQANDVWESLPLVSIKNKFAITPNKPDSLTLEDALLCSKAWQDVAHWLCSNMLNIDDVCIPLLKRNFGRLGSDKTKQDLSARQFMRQALLLPQQKIDDILGSIKW